MQNEKLKFILEIQDFAEDYKFNEDLLHTIKQTRKDLLELHEIFFHTDSMESTHLTHSDIILDTMEFHLQRIIDNQKDEDYIKNKTRPEAC